MTPPPRGQTPLLSIENLSVAYGGTPALRDVSLRIHPGECLAIVGESGSGKTTLARALLGLLPREARLAAGRALWQGEAGQGAIDLLREHHKRRRLLGQSLSYIPQSPLLSFDPLTPLGRQAVEPLEIHGLLKEPGPERAAELLESVAIDHPAMRARQHAFELSGGMLQRVLLASALSTHPRLVLADEPTASLDMLSQARVLELIDSQIASHGAALLLITHHLGMALDRADSIVVMRGGRIVEADATIDIARAPRDDYARHLLSHVRHATGQGGADAASPEPGIRPAARAAEAVPPTLELRGLSKAYPAPPGSAATGRRPGAHDISFVLPNARTLVLVGESGSGKSTVANLISGQTRPDSGQILLDGQPLDSCDDWVRAGLWRKIQLIHQDSLSTFDPRYTAAEVLGEPLRNLGAQGGPEARRSPQELLALVGLDPALATRQARSLSGGQAQWLAIARALAVEPRLLLLDEAVSALDVLVRAHVLDLLRRLQAELGLSYLFITHDLSVARDIADEILVMRAGHVIERGDPESLYRRPAQDYTRSLVGAIPGQRFLSRLNAAANPVPASIS